MLFKLLAGIISTTLCIKVLIPPNAYLIKWYSKDKSAAAITYSLAIFSIFYLANLVYFIFCPLSHINQEWVSIEIIALISTILGSMLRLWCFHTLGKYFTFNVGWQSDQQLVTTGPYRYLMHPSYTGQFLAMVGLPLFLEWRNLPIVVAIAFYVIYRILKRMSNEETMMKEHLGAKWEEYAKKRWRLFPGIY